MSFDLDKFTAEPSEELLNLGKKTDLLNLAKHYKLSEIKYSMRKHEIKNILVHYFVDEIFNENALSLIVDVQSASSSKELELKFQIRQLEIQERQKEREREREREREEREEREKERERERERKEREREERQKEREFQLRMREIEMQERANQPKQKIEFNFDVTKHIRLVPPFQEKEVDKYFLHFEKVAENLNWPKEHWTLLLQSVLIGKAREIYTQLGVEQSHHYETVKELILKGYELVPEAYRQKFRNCKKDSNQTHVEFARNKEQLFDRWCCSKKIDQNYDKSDPGPSKLENSDILRNLNNKLSHFEPSQQEELKQLIHEYEHLFPDIPTRTNKIYHDVIVEDSKPIKQHPYRMNPLKQKYLQDEVKYLLENDFIEASQSNYSSPCILVPKSNGTYRMCTDYRKVNSVTKTDSFLMLRIDDCIDKVGNSRYVTKFDLLKGFWQVPLTDRAKEVSAFATPNGLY